MKSLCCVNLVLGKQGPVKVGATPFDSSLAKSNEFPSGVSPGASHGESGTFLSSTPESSNENGLFGAIDAY